MRIDLKKLSSRFENDKFMTATQTMQKSKMFQGSLMYEVELPVLWYKRRYESGPVDGARYCTIASTSVCTCYAHGNPFAQHLTGKKGGEHIVRVQKEVINLIWV